MFVAYTNCETGFRHFTHLHGVDISFDQKFIAYVVGERGTQTKLMQQQQDAQEHHVREMKSQMQLPPIVDAVMEQNRKRVSEETRFAKRLTTADAVLNGTLVHSLIFTEDLKEAIDYAKRGA